MSNDTDALTDDELGAIVEHWSASEPKAGFADRAVSRLTATRVRRRWPWVVAAVAMASAAAIALWVSNAHDSRFAPATLSAREQPDLGTRRD